MSKDIFKKTYTEIKPCEYCKKINKKFLFKQGNDDFDHCYIGITEDFITINAHYDGLIGTEDNFKIKFCPMCGRKLGD